MSGSLETGSLLVGKTAVVAVGASVLGASIMAMARPPKTRLELFFQGMAAIGASILFGDTAVLIAYHYLPFTMDFVAVHGIVGALSWGIFGALAQVRDWMTTRTNWRETLIQILSKGK